MVTLRSLDDGNRAAAPARSRPGPLRQRRGESLRQADEHPLAHALQFVAFFRGRGRASMSLSAVPGNGSSLPFYEAYGFEQTGGEVVLRLRLA